MPNGIDRLEALGAANRFTALIGPYCEEVIIAGSIRRRKALVKDIEIVAVPAVTEIPIDLFGNTRADSLLEPRLNELLGAGVLEHRLDKNGRPAWGMKFKRTRFEGIALDLFITTREQYGGILAIRTGPAEFGHLCMTARQYGGAMPANMRQQDGALTRGGYPLATPTEESWFSALGLPCWEPWERTAERLRAHLRGEAVHACTC